MFLDGTSGVPATSYKAGTSASEEMSSRKSCFFLGVGEKNLEEKKRHVLKNPIRTHRKMKS